MSIEVSTIIAGVIAAAVVMISGPFLIPELHKLKFGQAIREEGPKSHQVKSGTPTMGGVMIIIGISVASLIMAGWSRELGLAMFMIIGHFILGFIDDYIKVVRKHNEGLKPRQKLVGQVIMAVIVACFGNLSTDLWVPFYGNLDLGYAFYFWLAFVMVGTTNAVNLTDGLDGLAAGTVAIAALSYTAVCYLLGHGDLMILAGAVVGGCLGFLKFNYHPARIFMGDTGSLALGGAMAALCILSHTELLMAVIGFIFLCEALSVIIQVASFQSTGKRVFLMSPIHHHFELKGWTETQVVVRFWSVACLAGAAGILLLKLGM